jgi:hypothetical protein
MNHSRPKPLPAGKRIPPFLPVPLRARADGWTSLRQAEFIGFLAESGCVATAAAAVGKSRQSAHRLRSLPGAESFVAAWDAACGMFAAPWKFTFAELQACAFTGPWVVHLRGGRYRGVSRKPSTSAILRVLAQLDRSSFGAEEPLW